MNEDLDRFFDFTPFSNTYLQDPAPINQQNSDEVNTESQRTLGFLDLPGEVRNRVYEYVTLNAVHPPKNEHIDARRSIARRFRVLVRPGHMYYRGIDSVPLLFVNKQVHEECAGVIYSSMGTVSLSVTRFKRFNNRNIGKPTYRCTFDALVRWPNLQKYARNLKIIIDSEEDAKREEGKAWNIVNYKHQSAYLRWGWGKPFESTGVIEDLARYLKTFVSLKTLKVAVTTSATTYLADFLPLYDLLEGQTKFTYSKARKRDPALGEQQRWLMAWDKCLRKHRDPSLEVDSR